MEHHVWSREAGAHWVRSGNGDTVTLTAKEGVVGSGAR